MGHQDGAPGPGPEEDDERGSRPCLHQQQGAYPHSQADRPGRLHAGVRLRKQVVAAHRRVFERLGSEGAWTLTLAYVTCFGHDTARWFDDRCVRSRIFHVQHLMATVLVLTVTN